MILYGSSLSPFVRKVLAFAGEKGIEIELKPTGDAPGQPGAEFLAASPLRKMPALVDGDYRLADSSAIIQYLEALHPEPNLIPAEPRARGRAIWFEEYGDTILMGCGGKIFFNRVVAPRFLRRPGDEFDRRYGRTRGVSADPRLSRVSDPRERVPRRGPAYACRPRDRESHGELAVHGHEHRFRAPSAPR